MNQTERPGATLCRIVGLILFLCSLSYQREASGHGRERGSSTVRLETPFKTPLRCSWSPWSHGVYTFSSQETRIENDRRSSDVLSNERSKGSNPFKLSSLSLSLSWKIVTRNRGKFAHVHRMFSSIWLEDSVKLVKYLDCSRSFIKWNVRDFYRINKKE